MGGEKGFLLTFVWIVVEGSHSSRSFPTQCLLPPPLLCHSPLWGRRGSLDAPWALGPWLFLVELFSDLSWWGDQRFSHETVSFCGRDYICRKHGRMTGKKFKWNAGTGSCYKVYYWVLGFCPASFSFWYPSCWSRAYPECHRSWWQKGKETRQTTCQLSKPLPSWRHTSLPLTGRWPKMISRKGQWIFVSNYAVSQLLKHPEVLTF